MIYLKVYIISTSSLWLSSEGRYRPSDKITYVDLLVAKQCPIDNLEILGTLREPPLRLLNLGRTIRRASADIASHDYISQFADTVNGDIDAPERKADPHFVRRIRFVSRSSGARGVVAELVDYLRADNRYWFGCLEGSWGSYDLFGLADGR